MDDAIREFEEHLRIIPDDDEAHQRLSITYGQQGQTAEAIREFEDALRIALDDAAAYQTWAWPLPHRVASWKARRAARKALQLSYEPAQERVALLEQM